MPTFTSLRERRLWFGVVFIVATIYATLGLAGQFAALIPANGVIENTFFGVFLVIVFVLFGNGMRKRTSKGEFWVTLGIVAAYAMAMLRLFVNPNERTHLVEYSIVAVLIYEALAERKRNGGNVWNPAIFTMLATALIGLVDELIQAVLPNRVFDPIDIGFNAFAGVMAVVSILVLSAVRNRFSRV